MESKPGDGKTSPFGNGDGSTSGSASGGHDFIKDNKSGASAPKITDFTAPIKMPPPDEQSYNPDSVPEGGDMPFSGEPQATDAGAARKPFKLNGE